MPVKKCVVCDSEFMARLSVYKTCGTVCRNRLIASEKLQRHTVTAPCIVCGKEFSNSGKQKNRKTCSPLCGHVITGAKKQLKIERRCKRCDGVFEVVPSSLKMYCSISCSSKGTKTESSCEKCGEKFLKHISQAYVRTCSVKCGLLIRVSPNYVGATYMKTFPDGSRKSVMHKSYANQKCAAYRAGKLRATPKWASEALILAIYEECQLQSEETGVPHHVDHVVPLISDIVCGLHCEDNLQVLPALENLSKGNRHWPDMP